ncbi:MAG: hypothetical protein O2809_05120 [Proteobacteria bacterium]|nr:hypothetical protein [Pseudomonadota bacterium]
MKKSTILLALTLYAPMLYANNSGFDWRIAPAFSYYHYNEPNVMKSKGPSIGLLNQVSYTQTNHLKWMIGLYLEYSHGSYSSQYTGSHEADISYLLNISPKIGYNLNIAQNWQITPFSGIGYRMLYNNSTGQLTTTRHSGYLRVSNYFYLPIGADLAYHQTDWFISSRFQFNYLIYGVQHSGVYGGINNPQHHGYGLHWSLSAGKNYQNFSLSIGPYINYWWINDSEARYADNGNIKIIEPQNDTLDLGIAITFGF